MKTLTEINAVCTSVEDLGVVETDYGSKPQVKFTFETRPENDDGHGRKLCRTFNKFFHEKSALCIAIKSWTGRDLAEEFEKIGESDLREFVGDEATLKILDHDLLPQVRTELEKISTGDRAGLETELAKAIAAARAAGFSAEQAEQSPKVKELRAQLAATVDVSALENEVLSDLANFFRRYYSGGDFLALRRYKAGVYAIPYEGEEVKLHWANADQYYIKTSEFLRDYTFKLADGKRIHFKLVEADTEADNKKSAAGQERRFILCAADPLVETDGELIIRFEYRPDADKRKQAELNTLASETILNVPGFAAWKAALARLAPTEKNPNRTLLEKHLGDYTARNSFDYFIHKDIGGFLRRELDFYIKNEIMHLDDIEAEDAPRVGQYLAKIKAIRVIARKIVDFLEQLENFQKKLWLKKKFVVETNYCVTLDRVAESLYPEIAANDAQWQEWEKLYAISEIAPDLFNQKKQGRDAKFLKANLFLVLDTKFFPPEFKEKLLANNKILNGTATLDEATDGLMIHSENFHALNLLQARYREQIQCTYIDPPFNLKQNADFLYKTDYKDSVWLQLLMSRVLLAKTLICATGNFYLRCDNNGNHLARILCDQIFGGENFQAELLVQRIRKNVTGQGDISMPLANDSLFLYYKSDASFLIDPYQRLDKKRASYWRRIDDSAGFRNPPERMILGRKFMPYKHDAHFKYSQESIDRMLGERRIRLRCKECGYEQLDGIWDGCPKCKQDRPVPQYLVEETDKIILDTNWTDISGYSSTTGFSTENSEALLSRALQVGSNEDDLVLDFFGGSGTTLAVAQKNGRKWIGIEMGNQFNDFILPRLKRVLKNSDERGGLFKYLRLESYEDALNNLDLKRTEAQDDLLRQHAPLREDYLLRYQLDVESAGSASLLAVTQFANPFAYQLKIATGSVGESRAVNVDLVETFNYLLGLRVSHTDTIRGFKVVTGLNPAGEKTLVIWRNVAEKSNADLDAFFQKQGYTTKDMEFAVIYVNGDNNLENLKRADETWKVRRIEDEFKRLMFDVQDV